MDKKDFEILNKGLDYATLVKTDEFKKIMFNTDMSLSQLMAGSNFTITLIGDVDCIVMYENETVLQVVYNYVGTRKEYVTIRVRDKKLQHEVREKLYCGKEVTLKIKGMYGGQFDTDFALAEIVDAKPRARKFKHYICKECGYDFGYDSQKHTTCSVCGGKLEFR